MSARASTASLNEMGPDITGSSSAELRARHLERCFAPMVRALFQARAEVRSVLLAVGHFHQHEGADEVDIAYLPFPTPKPTWPDCLMDDRFYDIEEDFGHTEIRLREKYQRLLPFAEYPNLRKNGSAVVAYAAYCLGGCQRDMSFEEAYLPYALARRRPDDDGQPTDEVEITVVGTLRRPDWEDRFDLLYPPLSAPGALSFPETGAGRISRSSRGELAVAEPEPPTPADNRFTAWIRSLFGGDFGHD